MRHFLLFFIIIFYFVFALLVEGRLSAEERTVSSAQTDARFTKATHPIDILKNAAKRTFETLKGMIFKENEGGEIAQKREDIMRERVEETKAAKFAEESSR